MYKIKCQLITGTLFTCVPNPIRIIKFCEGYIGCGKCGVLYFGGNNLRTKRCKLALQAARWINLLIGDHTGE